MKQNSLTVLSAAPSTACPDMIALDLSVEWRGIPLDLTLAASSDGRGTWGAWGDCVSHWCSDPGALETRDEIMDLLDHAIDAADEALECPQWSGEQTDPQAWRTVARPAKVTSGSGRRGCTSAKATSLS